MNARDVTRLLIASLFVWILLGCGGSGGGSASTLGSANPSVRIAWAARTRDVLGPASAMSAVIVFKNGAPNGTDVAWTVDRATAPAAYTLAYVSPTPLQPGVRNLQVSFFAGTEGQGGVVATASASVRVTAGSQIQNPNGSPFGSIQAVGNLASVAVVPNQIGTIGIPLSVNVSALDKAGNPVAITPASATLRVTAGAASIDGNGNLVATAEGTVYVMAIVDGISSPAVFVSIFQPAAILRTLTQDNNSLVLNPVTQTIWASVPSTAQSHGNSVVEINPSTGTILGSVLVGSEPTPVAISDDGSTLYVGLSGASTICSINTAGKTVGQQFAIGESFLQGKIRATEIAVQPGSTSVIAVTSTDVSDTGFNGAEIISNGAVLPNAAGFGQGQSIAFVSSTQLYAYNYASSPSELYDCLVDSSGISVQSHSPMNLGFTPILATDGRLYGSDGLVLDARSGSLLGEFAVTNGRACAVDSANHRAFFMENLNGNQAMSIAAFDTETFLPVGGVNLPLLPDLQAVYGYTHLLRYGPKGLAFQTPSAIYFLDQAPGL